jgi:hypothetical protein
VAGFIVSKTMVSCIVPEVCYALTAEFQDKLMKVPKMLKKGRKLQEALRRDGTSHMNWGPLMGNISGTQLMQAPGIIIIKSTFQ